MAEQEQTEKKETKGFAAVYDVNDKKDGEILNLLQIAKTVGGVNNKTIFNLGVKAYVQTEDFKKKAQVIKGLIG